MCQTRLETLNLQVADELYPETIEKQGGDDDDEDVDMEEMLERELAGMKTDDKSKRFSELFPALLATELTMQDYVCTKRYVVR